MAFIGNQFISRQSNDRFVGVRGHRGLLLFKLSCGKPSITKVLTAPVNNLEPKIIEVGNKIPMTETKLKLYAQNLKEFLEAKEHFNSLQGLRTQLESIVLSDFGELVTSEIPGINLFEAYTQSKIIFLFLDSRRYGETAKALGRFILQDLKSVSARVDGEVPKEQRKPFSVIIDEFADLAQEDFIGFLDRARSSRMSVVVAHQEICDLQRISPEFAGRLMGKHLNLVFIPPEASRERRNHFRYGGDSDGMEADPTDREVWVL